MEKIVGKVIGNTTSTPMAVPDWLQTDENKADFIKNKPDIDGTLKTVRDDITNLQISLDTKASADTVDAMAREVTETSEEVSKISSDVLGLSNEVRKVVSESSGKEMTANKSTTITSSDIKYPTSKAVKDYVDVIFDDLEGRLLEKESITNKVTDIDNDANNRSFPTTKAVKDYVDDEVANHSNNMSKHVTDEERERWNDKYSQGYIDEELALKEDAANKANVINETANSTSYPTTKAVREYVDAQIPGNTANALKGSASGNPLTITDISPIEHLMKTKIYSKNLFNYKAFVDYCKNVGGTGGNESVKYLSEECFSYVNYRSNTSVFFAIDGVQENTQYTFTFEYAFDYQDNESYSVPAFRVTYTDGTYDDLGRVAYRDEFTRFVFTTGANKTIQGIKVLGFSRQATIYVKKDMQIEEGTASTESVPHVATTPLIVSGKNLLDAFGRTSSSFTKYDATTARNFNYGKYYVGLSVLNASQPGVVTAELVDGVWNITSTVGGYGVSYPVKVLPNTQYKCSGNAEGSLAVSFYDVDGVYIGRDTKTSPSFVTPENCVTAVVGLLASTKNTTQQFSNIQLEIGTTATEYEPFVKMTEYTADETGVVNGLNSVYPTTVLHCNRGITIESEYNRDINKVIANLENAILTLGGST